MTGTDKPRRKVHRITIETEGLTDEEAATLHHTLITVASGTNKLHNYRSTALVREMRAAKERAEFTYVSAKAPTKIQ
ncbi:hypothetical protein HQ602_03740 [Rhodococcus kroppenstedtii]|uniref:hypothetical protein n=1 Tax=Rhodococcoides kroppenstedtii TaxID=293050 RepID=UPI001C9A33FC|nr:hypothetical protein [Rhodococcus kroppenstedtii]MBY6435488.1 hypothetical protein [Rhodococcus kroppenstedtii]